MNFLHFKDILLADFEIQISYSALFGILKNAGCVSPKKKKIRRRTHRRKRRPHSGQLIQIDATPFAWFGGNITYTLHGAIDDAAGKVVGLFLTKNECLYGYLETMRQCCLDFGVPQTIYSDNHTIFRFPKTGKLTVEELIDGKTVPFTQFGRDYCADEPPFRNTSCFLKNSSLLNGPGCETISVGMAVKGSLLFIYP